MKKVVVAIDGSDASRAVIDYAIHYAVRDKDAELLFPHFIGALESRSPFVAGYKVDLTESEKEAKDRFESYVGECLEHSGVEPERFSVWVRTGNSCANIIDFADEKDADIIMIGHRGMSRLNRFFIGSVAARVVANAPCSVYVHRPKGKSPEGV